jgi:AraC-like DNA-binding protein
MRQTASRGTLHDPLGPGASLRLERGCSARWDFFWHAHAACELIVMANGAEHPGPVSFRWRIGMAEGVAHHPAAFLVAPGLAHAFWTEGFLPNNQAIASGLAWWDPALTALPPALEWKGIDGLLQRARRGVRFDGAAAALACERFAADPVLPARRAALVIDLLALLAADGGSDCNPADPPPVDARRDLERLAAVEALLVQRFREPLTLPEVARRCGMSESTLNALLKRHHRATFLDVLNRVRVDRAKEALRRSRDDVTTVALACGFGSIATFNRRFLRHEGVSPQAWRDAQG